MLLAQQRDQPPHIKRTAKPITDCSFASRAPRPHCARGGRHKRDTAGGAAAVAVRGGEEEGGSRGMGGR